MITIESKEFTIIMYLLYILAFDFFFISFWLGQLKKKICKTTGWRQNLSNHWDSWLEYHLPLCFHTWGRSTGYPCSNSRSLCRLWIAWWHRHRSHCKCTDRNILCFYFACKSLARSLVFVRWLDRCSPSGMSRIIGI